MDVYLGTIIPWAPSFAPQGWAICDGSLLPIAQNSALFSLLSTMYGGDGVNNFALPDLRGRVVVGTGQGPTTPAYAQGSKGGAASVVLTTSQLPAHNHPATFTPTGASLQAVTANATSSNTPAAGKYLGKCFDNSGNGGDPAIYAPAGGATVALGGLSFAGSVATGATGNGGAVSVIQNYQSVLYIIAIEGIYPTRP